MSDYTSDEIGLQTYRLITQTLEDAQIGAGMLPHDPEALYEMTATMLGFLLALESSGFPVARASKAMTVFYETRTQ